METNEALKQTLLTLAESSVESVLSGLQNLQEGDWHTLEQQMVAQVFEVGRKWLEQILQQQGKQERAVARREGSCGHRQRLVGLRHPVLPCLLTNRNS